MIERYKIAKAMHEIIRCMNNEEAYMEWINTVPDEPSDDDFQSIAEDDWLFAETCKAFKSIFTEYQEDGLFIDNRLW